MLTTSDLAFVRAETAFVLDTSTVIERPATTPDAAGFAGEAWAAAGTVLGRLVRVALQTGAELAGREQGRAAYTLLLPQDADLRDGDRVAVAGARYDVQQVHRAASGRTFVRATVIERA